MLTKIMLVLGVAVGTMLAANDARADQYVRGHVRHYGAYGTQNSYVQPHYRSNADGIFRNNWSTSPNVNPYTGSVGTRHYPTYNHTPTYRTPSSSFNFFGW